MQLSNRLAHLSMALCLITSVNAGCGSGKGHKFKTYQLPANGHKSTDYTYLDTLGPNDGWNIYGYYNGKSCFNPGDKPDMITGGYTAKCTNVSLVPNTHLSSMAVWIASDLDLEVRYSPCNVKTDALTAFDKLSCAQAGQSGWYCIDFEDTPPFGGIFDVQSYETFAAGSYP